jgi:general nucleoside transport system ATP-binding protein
VEDAFPVDVLEATGISKRFSSVLANDGIDFRLAGGEIHAILGENGAGKTTLMSILYGLLQPDCGTLRVRGEPCHFRSPLDALRHGIGMVHQHFMLIPTMTVAENIMLGREITRGPFISLRRASRRIREVAEQYGMDVHPDARVSQLSVGEQQRVEILKALYRGAEILILDEPTAALTPPETAVLFESLSAMRRSGKSVVFISHKLREVMSLSDRVTVLREGRVLGTRRTGETTEPELARMMIGREAELTGPGEAHHPGAAPLLSVSGLRVPADRAGLGVKAVSFELAAGEILGIAGVDGNGQPELAEALAGLRRPAAGRILVDGRDVTSDDPRRRAARGVAYVPADRNVRGAVPGLSVAANAVLTSHRARPYSRWGILNHAAIHEHARQILRENEVKCPSPSARTGSLSGGNLQKLVLGRELARAPRLLVVEHPTRGLDMAATGYVRALLLKRAAAGAAVVLISADLDEILAVSDRVLVMYEGTTTYAAPRPAVDMNALGLAMAGRDSGRRT